MTSESWRGDVSDGVDAWIRSTPVVEPGERRAPVVEPGERRAPVVEPGERQRARVETPGAPEDPQALGPDADPESVARTILLDQLTGRARSRQELADKLRAKGVPDDVAVRLLDRFTEVGLIDDEAFARSWVEGRRRSRGLATRAIGQELRRKGVDDETVREVLDEVDPDAEEQAARLLVRKKLRSLSRVDDVTATRRLVGMLARKGYGSGTAFAVVKDELARASSEGARDEPRTRAMKPGRDTGVPDSEV